LSFVKYVKTAFFLQTVGYSHEQVGFIEKSAPVGDMPLWDKYRVLQSNKAKI